MIQGSLFPEPHATVPDGQVVKALQDAIARTGRLSRSADLLLCGVCARYLVEELRGLGLEVVRAPARRASGSLGYPSPGGRRGGNLAG
jgi:hypothetical protein